MGQSWCIAWSYGRVIYSAKWILMRGTVQEEIREIRTYINLLFWTCSKIMEGIPLETRHQTMIGRDLRVMCLVLCCCRAGRSSCLRIWWSCKVWEFWFQFEWIMLWNSCIDLQYYQLINYVQLRQHSQRWLELCAFLVFDCPMRFKISLFFFGVAVVNRSASNVSDLRTFLQAAYL